MNRTLALRRDFVLVEEPPPPGPTPGGIILPPTASVATDGQGHEVIVVNPGKTDLRKGDRVILSVSRISAFIPFEGRDYAAIPDSDVLAIVHPDGRIQPRGRYALLQRDDETMMRCLFGAESRLALPESHLATGFSASGDPDPQQGGDRTRDAVTGLYAIAVEGPGLERGQVVCFSPSYCATRLQVGRQHYWLADADELFFIVE